MGWNYWNFSYQTEDSPVSRHCIIDMLFRYWFTDLFCETSYWHYIIIICIYLQCFHAVDWVIRRTYPLKHLFLANTKDFVLLHHHRHHVACPETLLFPRVTSMSDNFVLDDRQLPQTNDEWNDIRFNCVKPSFISRAKFTSLLSKIN